MRIRLFPTLVCLLGASACVDAGAPESTDVDFDEDAATTSPVPPDPLEDAVVQEEAAPVAAQIDSLAELYPPNRAPRRQSPEEMGTTEVIDTTFPPHDFASPTDDDVTHSTGNTASNDFHDQFGHALATGRFSSTTIDSIVASAPYDDLSTSNRNSGKLYHFVNVLNTFVAAAWHSEGTHSGRAGWSFGVGDFDHDGFEDLAVGMPWNTASVTQAGEVAIYKGSATGLVLWTELSQTVPEYGDRFGAALAVGDFDNDGRRDDIAVGSPGEDNGRGAVYVYRTNAGVLGAFATLTETGLGTRSDYEHFGATLAAGDIRGTAHDDLLVGAVDETVDGKVAGSVFLYTGAAATMTGSEVIAPAFPEHDMGFGRALAVGDFDDDGDDDVAIGQPGASRTAGSVRVLRTAANELSHWGLLTEELADHDIEVGDRFGAALATGDIDDDGRDDLVVGAPGEKYNDGAGLVFAFQVPTFLWSPIGSGWRSQYDLGSNEAGDRFGAAIAIVEQAGPDMMVVAAPSETVGSSGVRSGAVFVYDGGAAFDSKQLITQN
jgi:hypothetical protein